MAGRGRRGRGAEGAAARAPAKEALVAAAVEIVREEGFSAASARAIAERAGCAQGLVFYHFGSVTALLLAALDAVSAERSTRYSAAMAAATSPADLARLARAILDEDLEAGHAAVLVQLIAGASSTPGLGTAVAERLAPWRALTRETVEGVLGGSGLAALFGTEELAHGVVALILGLELLSGLDDDRTLAHGLFERLGVLGAALAPPAASS